MWLSHTVMPSHRVTALRIVDPEEGEVLRGGAESKRHNAALLCLTCRHRDVLHAMPNTGRSPPKVLTSEAAQASDYIITMGCGGACPYFPGKTYLDRQFEDPAGQGVEDVRPLRDEIKSLIEGLIVEIVAKKS